MSSVKYMIDFFNNQFVSFEFDVTVTCRNFEIANETI